MPRDLYCPFYNVTKAWIGPTRITELGVFIYNRPAYRRDEMLVDLARERLIRAIQTKKSPDVIAASGGIEDLRRRAEAQEFFL